MRVVVSVRHICYSQLEKERSSLTPVRVGLIQHLDVFPLPASCLSGGGIKRLLPVLFQDVQFKKSERHTWTPV